ncbi:Lipoprotein [Vibrio crassostreae]|uniref:hypothetical protein n=1 Tax=Vibrio crassostreae TaxID=246167 RepID=UPI000F490E8D|nr:hypothetical protein [Vibrio crassostreae]NOH73558.1 hypothetical protein [Vibrio crassostreae]ROR19895.1 hypothetical protein EDB36_1011053 [Vibrio crassostreae]CAK2159594.1 Lipoprotein [Vibrio crassostreae]CAK2361346.1 Lipoprotein [Vibrio crassostreae]CAK2375535.1 Lipoprotein [Vibrio crassostreae]
MRSGFCVILLIVLSACATTPVSNSSAKLAPSVQVLSDNYSFRTNSSATLIIKRDSGFMGSTCNSRIHVDGNPVVDLGTTEYLELYLDEGLHILSAQPNGICAGGLSEIAIDLKAGKTSNYRVGMGTNGDYFLVPTAF